MLLRILPILFLASAMFAQSPVALPIEAGVSQELAKWRAARYSDVRYKLNLTLEKMSPVLKGTMEIRLQHSVLDCQECPLISIVLDWRKIKGSEALSTISNVTINDRPTTLLKTGEVSKRSGSIRVVDSQGKVVPDKTLVKYEERNEHLIFEEGVVMGENVIKLDFTSPILTSGSAITRYVDKEDGAEYIYSLFVPSDASTAFPVFDQPDLKARFSLTATVPDDSWKMISNGVGSCFRIVDGVEPPQEKPLCPFAETKPISTYVFAFAAGPFVRVSVPPALAGGTLRDANPTSGKSETPPPADAGGTDSDERVSVPPALAGGKMLDGNPVSGKSETSPPADAGGTDSDERVSVPPALAGGTMPDTNPESPKSETSPPADAGGTDSDERVSVPPALAGGRMRDANPESPKSETPPPADAGGTDLGERVSSPHVSKGSAAGVDPSLTVGLRTPPTTSIYVRKSQAEKFKPHAAEVFRLNREAIKYFEEYFDYKFPFPKYDLVLIPEFPFGGMEHAGATFLRESAIIFPQEPTKNDHISRALLIFHEAAHQWFGDTVTMRWFDDLWLKEGFANFAAYKAMERIMPEANAWKVFYERIKQGAYQTDSTKGTTPIYQEIKNLSAAKSAYGNIVYNKAPAFLRQAEFYLGEDKFQTAVRAFLKKHEFGNAGWEDLVKEFETVYWSPKNYSYFNELTPKKKKEIELRDKKLFRDWANYFVKQPGVPTIKVGLTEGHYERRIPSAPGTWMSASGSAPALGLTLSKEYEESDWSIGIKALYRYGIENEITETEVSGNPWTEQLPRLFDKNDKFDRNHPWPDLIFPNYQDYGYGIFLLDDKSRDYVLKNIQNEKDPFLRAMMWGALWDSVREGELDPREYVELVVRVLSISSRKSTTPSAEAAATPPIQEGSLSAEDESTIATLLGRTSTALNYYIGTMQKPDREGGRNGQGESYATAHARASASVGDLRGRVESMLIERMRNADTLGQRITYYRAFLNVASSENARTVLKKMLADADKSVPLALASGKVQTNGNVGGTSPPANAGGTDLLGKLPLRTKDKFDIVTKLLILGDTDGPKLLAELEKKETSDEAKRYAYAAKAGIATAENKAKYWNDFVNNKEISESWIEAAFGPFNSIRHNELTLPYLQKALQELPNHKRSRKIFFVNGWLGAFIGGQRSEEALAIVNKFLADNPNLDKDLRLKILENVDVIERAVKIRAKFKN